MKRRRFLSSMAIILPASIVSTEFILSSCNGNADVKKEEFFSDENVNLLDEIGETIIPATPTSPGAKAAKIGAFMKVYVTDCYTPEQQTIFWNGINKVKEISKNKYKNVYLKLSVSQKSAVLQALENESKEYLRNKNSNTGGNGDAVQTGKGNADKMDHENAHFYPMIKELTLFGFFTSQPGATKALRYIQTPGSYKGDVPYKKGDKAWAT